MSHHGPAKPVVAERSRLSRALPWAAAALAAVAAALWFGRHLRQRGPEIVVSFDDVTGLGEDSLVMRHGVELGKVQGLSLSEDKRRTAVRIRLSRDQDDFAREGAVYWLVKPRLSGGGLGGLNTLATGPYIEAAPGAGERRSRFDGLSQPPASTGLELVLAAPRLDGLSAGAPVSYRGVAVGEVRGVRLGSSGDAAEASVVVWKRYAPLVRAGSKFWQVSGFAVEGGVLKGIEVKLESLRELASGGITFATPEKDAGAAAEDGRRFPLEDKPKKEWLGWAPKIPLEGGPQAPAKVEPLPSGQDFKQSQSRKK